MITSIQILFVNVNTLKGHCEGLLVSMNDLDKKIYQHHLFWLVLPFKVETRGRHGNACRNEPKFGILQSKVMWTSLSKHLKHTKGFTWASPC